MGGFDLLTAVLNGERPDGPAEGPPDPPTRPPPDPRQTPPRQGHLDRAISVLMTEASLVFVVVLIIPEAVERTSS